MKLKISWKRTAIACLMIAIVSFAYHSYTSGSSPQSGQNWNIVGGGFCDSTYVIYNVTSTNTVYAVNCKTGGNDCSSATDVAIVVNCAIGLMNGGVITFRDGYYGLRTSIIQSSTICTTSTSFGCGGYWLRGSGEGSCTAYQAAAYTCAANATAIVATAHVTNMIEGTSNPTFAGSGGGGSPAIHDNHVTDLTLMSNGLATNGVNYAANENGGDNDLVEHVRFTNYHQSFSNCPGGFSGTAIIFDGAEDSWIRDNMFDGAGNAGGGDACAASQDIQWQVPVGNIQSSGNLYGGKISIAGVAQSWTLYGGTVSEIKVLGDSQYVGGQSIFLSGNYGGNVGPISAGFLMLNSHTVGTLVIDGGYWTLFSSGVMIVGPGTLKAMSIRGSTWAFGGGSTWSSGSPTLPATTICGGDNFEVSGSGVPTGFPCTQVSGVF